MGKFELQITGQTTAYLKLPTHPGVLRNAKNIVLSDLIGAYSGPYVVFDFSSEGELVGIEIIADDEAAVENGEDTGAETDANT